MIGIRSATGSPPRRQLVRCWRSYDGPHIEAAIALNDNWIKSTLTPVQDADRAAANLKNCIQAARNLNLDAGWGAEQKAAAGNVLAGLGVAPLDARHVSDAQTFRSAAMDRLIAQKGMQTEGDADRAKRLFLAIESTREANGFVLDFAQAKANMDQRKAQYYEQALPLAQRSGDLTRVDREWRKLQGSVWADPILQRWSK